MLYNKIQNNLEIKLFVLLINHQIIKQKYKDINKILNFKNNLEIKFKKYFKNDQIIYNTFYKKIKR